jgi:hypothetical protein
MKSTEKLEVLRWRVAGGDSAAAGELRHRLEPAITALVRRALLFPADCSPLQADVRTEVRSLGLTPRAEALAEDRPTVRLIAKRICARLISRFQVGRTRLPARETVSDLARYSCSV